MFDPWVWKTPWRREWRPTPVFLPGEFHKQRSLVGYSPQSHCKVGGNNLILRWEKQGLTFQVILTPQLHTGSLFLYYKHKVCCCCAVAKLCPALCNAMSPPGPSVHGIFQAKILEWVAISFCRGIFPTQESNLYLLLGRPNLYHWATWEAHKHKKKMNYKWLWIYFQMLVLGLLHSSL